MQLYVLGTREKTGAELCPPVGELAQVVHENAGEAGSAQYSEGVLGGALVCRIFNSHLHSIMRDVGEIELDYVLYFHC